MLKLHWMNVVFGHSPIVINQHPCHVRVLQYDALKIVPELSAFSLAQAWFKHAEPHPLWGIFPRLAYELFQDKGDGWKITMKYFQNVVETVR